MKTSLYRGLEEDMAEEVRRSFASSGIIRRRVVELLKAKSNTSHRNRMAIDEYECPNWSHKQADSQGYQRALSEVISILEGEVVLKTPKS